LADFFVWVITFAPRHGRALVYGTAWMRILPTALVLCLSPHILLLSSAQAPAQAQQTSGAAVQTPQNDSASAVLRIVTREVLVDVVATDDRNRPVRDLTQQDVEVLEVKDRGRKDAAAIASFRSADAALEDAQPAPQSGGFRVSLGGDCAARATFHYEISFHPDEEGWQSGYHEIEVRTTRRGVKLAYHSRYYVGAKDVRPALLSVKETAAALQEAACYHADVPPSIGLSARPVVTDLKNVMRYFVTVDADSLAFISVSFGNQRVQLDYGACVFNAQGRPVRYFSSAADRMLSSSEYAQATVHGFPNLLEFPRMDEAAMMRVVVRDRTTGNIGVTDFALGSRTPAKQVARSEDDLLVAQLSLKQINVLDNAVPGAGIGGPGLMIGALPGPVGSFGSIEAQTDSFCGDVYELKTGTAELPEFWNLSSIGSLYVHSLNVPHQIFTKTGGVPGVTERTEWFGIDYHAQFWITRPGLYAFRMMVDDGAKLFIDDRQVVGLDGVYNAHAGGGEITLSAGEHTMHVPYFQGLPTAVGLALAVKGPGKKTFRIFDLREFAAPDGKPGSGDAAK
jgi:PA14 domain